MKKLSKLGKLKEFSFKIESLMLQYTHFIQRLKMLQLDLVIHLNPKSSKVKL